MKCRKFDPVHMDEDGKWYFWDETFSNEEGPYHTEEECRKELDRYVNLNGELPGQKNEKEKIKN